MYKKFFLFFIFFTFFVFKQSFSSEIFSYFGRTGLITIPSAYTINDGNLAIGVSKAYPYTRPYVNVGFFPGLEIGGVITIIENINLDDNPKWEGYGSYKDKAFFLKYQILPEMDIYPAIAIGWDDFHGTKLFETKYIVISKYTDGFIPNNLTIGYGNGVLKGFFAGGEILLHPKVSFIWEYAPLDTKKLKGINYLKTKYNIGLKFQPISWLQTTLSFQRGEKFGVSITFDIPMGEPWLPHKEKYFLLTKEDIKMIKTNQQTKFFEKALERLDFEYPAVYISEDTLYIEFYNKGYFYTSVALKKVLSIFKVVYFKGIKKVVFIIKEKNIPILLMELKAESINNYLNGLINFQTLLQQAKYYLGKPIKVKKNLVFSHPYFNGNFKIRSFLNDPSGAFKYELSYNFSLKEYLFNNFIFQGYLTIPIKNNISSINPPLMDKPIRSDIDKFLGYENIKIPVLSLSYISPLFRNTFIGASLGYNEFMFAGIGGDIIHFLGEGKSAIGVGGDWVIKRKARSLLGLENYSFHDYYLSYYYTMEYPEINLNIKAGRFLAGDKGVRIELSRVVKGFEVGFWYTYSDTSDFTGDNKNYHDKGVFIRIPMRIFKLKDTPQEVSFSLAPWTRDVGQLAGRPINIYRTIRNKTPFYIKLKANEKE